MPEDASGKTYTDGKKPGANANIQVSLKTMEIAY
jgi:hypothetical protein